MLKIDDLNKLKITSITAVIHFNYEDKNYFIHTNNESTTNTTLYEGRTKFKNEPLKSCWGYIPNLIKYKYNKKTLSSIDKRNFVKQLYKAELIDTYDEIKIEVEREREEYKQISKQIEQLNQRLIEIKNS